MKKIILIIVVFGTLCQQKIEQNKIEAFSNQLVRIISEKDKLKLKEIKVYPGDNSLTLQSMEYLIGKNDKFNLSELMKKKSLKILIAKNTEEESEFNIYRVIFYNSKLLRLNENGFFDIDDDKLWQFWGKEYIATELIQLNEKVFFYLTPFFYETDF